MADWPASLKPIGKYIVRAREVQATQPLVAYYCNYYALKRAIELRDTSDQNAHRLVTGLLEKCEADKATLGSDDGSHRGIIEEFSLSVFDRADAEDREDRATKETAQTFYAAVCFFEVCRVFGPLPSDLEQRLRYAKWKAVDISKALKEGRRPVPGAPGEAEAIEEQRLAAEAQKAAEQVAPSAPPSELTDGLNSRQDFGSPRRQSDENIPPAPPMREYDSDLKEYQAQPMPKERFDGSAPYPSVAPPYPSADISPLPHQAPASTAAKDTSTYPSMSSAYPTTDAPYRTSNAPYPSTSGYPAHPAPSAPYLTYATEDTSQREPPKAPVMPPIPSLDIPGIGTNMGDPPPGKPIYPLEAKASHWPPPSEPSFAPPPSNPYAPPDSDSSYPPSQLDAPYASRSNPSYAPPRLDHVHEQSRPDSTYPKRSEPPPAPQQQSGHGYGFQRYDSFQQRPPANVPQQAPVQTTKPAVPAPITQKAASTHVPSVKEAQEAQRLAKYAASALDFQDMKTAVANLEEALKLLKGA